MATGDQTEPGLIALDSIEAALADIRAGKMVVVVDDLDRENEGDMICAAACITPELVSFMCNKARGLICVSITDQRRKELNLPMMVNQNSSIHHTAFTVSVDLLGHGCTTGISAHDRSKTILALADPATEPQELATPGHIFPLRAADNGVLERRGHTEAAIDLARLAGLPPVGVLVEVLNDDGSMARLPDLRKIADRFDMKLVSIEDLVAYRLRNDPEAARPV